MSDTKSEESESPDVLARVEAVGAEAGLTGQRTGDLLMYGFELPGGRRQTLAIRKFAQTDDGMNIISFISPCERLGSGFFSGMSKKTALELLRLNSQLPNGAFCLSTIGGTEHLCVRATQILETMEVEEFEAHCMAVASLADIWEMRIGKDEF
ncbi:MAG: type III secretion system chaperone family protein [Planctomycetota bacterium]|jgi:hypothetical protein